MTRLTAQMAKEELNVESVVIFHRRRELFVPGQDSDSFSVGDVGGYQIIDAPKDDL